MKVAAILLALFVASLPTGALAQATTETTPASVAPVLTTRHLLLLHQQQSPSDASTDRSFPIYTCANAFSTAPTTSVPVTPTPTTVAAVTLAPAVGDVAVTECYTDLKSYDNKCEFCVAPVNATCSYSSSGGLLSYSGVRGPFGAPTRTDELQ
ncbi:hypothetical protein Gpo141_00015041 [Globisporangium polare]